MEALEAQMSVQESQLASASQNDTQGSFRFLEISERSGERSLPLGDTKDQPIAIPDEGSSASQLGGDSQAGGQKRDFEAYAHDSQESGSPSAQVSWARVEAYNAMMRNVLG
ncbi:hypothetical protein IMZ48_39820, partial [Candidatus Bathyarchaeota archaeon]|nr:hypothetical protein [Candidatus Bathyarchaeota archaeon]